MTEFPSGDPERVAHHVEAFNHAVRSGDWITFSSRFAEDARMTFTGVPAGPFVGREAIVRAYQSDGPTDVILPGEVTTEDDVDLVKFAWSRGGTGVMRFGWDHSTGLVTALDVSFD